jgi:hypothetical protein
MLESPKKTSENMTPMQGCMKEFESFGISNEIMARLRLSESSGCMQIASLHPTCFSKVHGVESFLGECVIAWYDSLSLLKPGRNALVWPYINASKVSKLMKKKSSFNF